MIGIVFIGDLKYCPYLNKYLKVLDELNAQYEILYWNRGNTDNNIVQNSIAFNKRSKLNKHPISKAMDFLQFANWLRSVIKMKKYSKMIILSTLSGIIISNLLMQEYCKGYVFDIRDYSYENIKYFYNIEEKLILNSNFTCISSSGFKEFLPPNYPYIIAHNFNYNDLEYHGVFKKKPKGSILNLVWNGTIRYFGHQSALLDRLKNDERFKIVYHGIGPEYDLFKKYCEETNINNVEFTGEYRNSDKAKLLLKADIINNCYGTKKENEVKYAIANKFYDGIIFRIPQLVEVGTFKEEAVNSAGIGLGLDVHDESYADKLYNYYFSINEEEFNQRCENELNKVLNEDIEYLNKIREFLTI